MHNFEDFCLLKLLDLRFYFLFLFFIIASFDIASSRLELCNFALEATIATIFHLSHTQYADTMNANNEPLQKLETAMCLSIYC